MAGEPIDEGSIVVKGGRIVQIGSKVDAPFLSKKINLSGRTITPGFIDAWSALGRLPGSPTDDPTSLAWDAFDRYANDDFQDALRHGVTSFYFGASGSAGITGVGALIRLVPGDGGTIGEVVRSDAALCINLDSGAKVISRLKTFRSVRKQFKDALDYRQSLEDYEEELEEYLKKLEERAKEKDEGKEEDEGEEKEDSKSEGSEEDADADEKKPAPDDDPDPTPKPDPDPEPKPEPTPEPSKSRARGLTTKHDGNSSRMTSTFAADKDQEKKKNGDEKDGEKKEGDEEEEELEKPEEPTPDRKSDVLLKAIDHEMPVRITAHRSADILNALALADEFNLDILIEGATEARFVADQLSKASVSVVLGPTLRGGSYVNNEFRRHAENTGDALSAAGVQWTVTSGGQSSAAARFVGINAQLAAAHNRTTSDWLRLVTTDAAKILGLSDRSGRLVRGGQADFVVWSGDPSDPSSRVELVYVAGQLAYEAKRTSTQAGGGR